MIQMVKEVIHNVYQTCETTNLITNNTFNCIIPDLNPSSFIYDLSILSDYVKRSMFSSTSHLQGDPRKQDTFSPTQILASALNSSSTPIPSLYSGPSGPAPYLPQTQPLPVSSAPNSYTYGPSSNYYYASANTLSLPDSKSVNSYPSPSENDYPSPIYLSSNDPKHTYISTPCHSQYNSGSTLQSSNYVNSYVEPQRPPSNSFDSMKKGTMASPVLSQSSNNSSPYEKVSVKSPRRPQKRRLKRSTSINTNMNMMNPSLDPNDLNADLEMDMVNPKAKNRTEKKRKQSHQMVSSAPLLTLRNSSHSLFPSNSLGSPVLDSSFTFVSPSHLVLPKKEPLRKLNHDFYPASESSESSENETILDSIHKSIVSSPPTHSIQCISLCNGSIKSSNMSILSSRSSCIPLLFFLSSRYRRIP